MFSLFFENIFEREKIHPWPLVSVYPYKIGGKKEMEKMVLLVSRQIDQRGHSKKKIRHTSHNAQKERENFSNCVSRIRIKIDLVKKIFSRTWSPEKKEKPNGLFSSLSHSFFPSPNIAQPERFFLKKWQTELVTRTWLGHKISNGKNASRRLKKEGKLKFHAGNPLNNIMGGRKNFPHKKH